MTFAIRDPDTGKFVAMEEWRYWTHEKVARMEEVDARRVMESAYALPEPHPQYPHLERILDA